MTNYAVVQQNSGAIASVGAGLTATVTLSSATTAGNKVFVAAVSQTLGTIVGTGSGLTKDLNPVVTGSTSNQVFLFSKDTSGGETSWTLTGFSNSGNAVAWTVIEVSGLASGGPDKTITAGGSTTPVASRALGTTATTTSATELAVAVAGALVASGSTTFTSWSNSYVQQGSTGTVTVISAVAFFGIAFLELTTTQTTTTTVSFSPNAAGWGGIATYIEGSSTPTNRFLPFF